MKRPLIIAAAFALAFCAAVSAGVCFGAVRIPVSGLFSPENHTVLMLRSLRVCLGLIAGCGLAVSGAALQAVLRNPLAEPYLLGTSSGAGLGAVCALMMGVTGLPLPFAALLGALASTGIVYRIARQRGRMPLQSLILSGVIVSIALSALTLFLISVGSAERLHSEIWWLWGSLSVSDPRLLALVGILVAAGTLAIYLLSRELNAISLGEEEALHLGIETERLKKSVFFVTSLVTAAVICVCGTIGFVGLIIPHAMRRVTGPDHRVLIPASSAAGGIFIVLCDLAGRTLFAPMEIPIGVITAAIGAPVFIILLRLTSRRFA